MFFKRDPLKQIQQLVDQAERIGITHLEANAVKGTITKGMLIAVARALRQHPDELLEMVPDRRRASRHAKALEGLRKANLASERQTFADYERYNNN